MDCLSAHNIYFFISLYISLYIYFFLYLFLSFFIYLILTFTESIRALKREWNYEHFARDAVQNSLLIVKFNSEVCIRSHVWMAERSKASYVKYDLNDGSFKRGFESHFRLIFTIDILHSISIVKLQFIYYYLFIYLYTYLFIYFLIN